MPRLPAEDVRLWRHAMRDVAPLRRRLARPASDASLRPHPDLPPPEPEGSARSARAAAERAAAQPTPPLPPLDRFAGVDRATAERLKRGRRQIEARLDLHGMTQAEAHRALAGFVAASRAGGLRCVLVVTGHGRAGGGVLKASVPRWLDEAEFRRHVLALAPARPKDGAGGALYLLLRRLPRPEP